MGIVDSLEPSKPSSKMPPPAEDTQRTCIDLPGEAARCYLYKSKLQVVLRKHRDVIFDIDLGIGATYTVEADKSDFYNARDKKLVERKHKQKVTFKDGERLHLWVSRRFTGHLILRSDGKVLASYEPNQLDTSRYDDDPKTKPAPLMVVMGHGATQSSTSSTLGKGGVCTPGNPRELSAEQLLRMSPTEQMLYGLDADRTGVGGTTVASEREQNVQDMHIVEVRNPNGPDVPKQVLDFFEHGGEETAVDTTGEFTRNWLIAQIAGATAYYADNRHWINELWKEKFYLQKVVHKAGTRFYIVFKGLPGLRKYLTAARYGVLNPKVISISSGAASMSGVRHAAWEATKGSLKKAGALAVVFTIALDTAEWLGDYEQRDPKTGKPKKDFFDLATKIGVDLAKAGIAAALGTIAMAALVAFGVVTGGAVVVIGAIAISVLVGYGLDLLDKKTHATDRLSNSLRESNKYLRQNLPGDYQGYPDAIENEPQFLFGP